MVLLVPQHIIKFILTRLAKHMALIAKLRGIAWEEATTPPSFLPKIGSHVDLGQSQASHHRQLQAAYTLFKWVRFPLSVIWSSKI